MKNECIWKKELTKEESQQVLRLQQVGKTKDIYHKLDLNFAEEAKPYAEHLLYWEEDQLKGYVWCTQFEASTLEATMIIPDSRDIFSVLLNEIRLHSESKGTEEIFFIVDSTHLFLTEGLRQSQCKLIFSEYYMEFQLEDLSADLSAAVSLVQPEPEDLPDLELLLEGKPLEDDIPNTFLYKNDEELLACIRLEEADGLWGIYGFVVNADCRGKGLGRKVLSTVLHLIKKENPVGVYLEVETENKRAYQLYLSEGFQVRNQYDYYALKL